VEGEQGADGGARGAGRHGLRQEARDAAAARGVAHRRGEEVGERHENVGGVERLRRKWR